MVVFDDPDERRALKDSLDKIEFLMELEQRLTDEINADASLTPEQRSRMIHDLEDRIMNWDWEKDSPDDLGGDSPLSIYVRKWIPRGPGNRSGNIALWPEPDPIDPSQDAIAEPPSPQFKGPFEDAAGIR